MTGRIGVEHNGITVTVEHLPDRKKPYLTIQEKGALYGVAQFTNEDMADFFLTKMKKFFDSNG